MSIDGIEVTRLMIDGRVVFACVGEGFVYFTSSIIPIGKEVGDDA